MRRASIDDKNLCSTYTITIHIHITYSLKLCYLQLIAKLAFLILSISKKIWMEKQIVIM